jgi:hypothetical protein
VKLRVRGDSLRLRLTRGEVQQLGQSGAVEERVHIAPDRALVYRLQRASAAATLCATFENGVVEIQVPETQARAWCESDLVTLEHVQAYAEVRLRIVVEKDYACLAPREDEDEADKFPHPNAGSTKC